MKDERRNTRHKSERGVSLPELLSRRRFLLRSGSGLGTLALSGLLARDLRAMGEPSSAPYTARTSHRVRGA